MSLARRIIAKLKGLFWETEKDAPVAIFITIPNKHPRSIVIDDDIQGADSVKAPFAGGSPVPIGHQRQED